ncbi:MAG: hypothetical protein RI957_923 [Verrucomicrobiota bacterium]|jgi:hypothetical protein
MRKLILSLTLFLCLPFSLADGKAKVFILSGQSNMSGGGDVVADLGVEATVAEKVRIWDATDVWGNQGAPGKWTSLTELQEMKNAARANKIGPEFGFAKAMAAQYPANEIHLIKVSKGGTPINYWLPDANGKPNGFTSFQTNLKNALEKIEGEYEIVGILWMQGESDAKIQADAEAYQKKLEQLIALMRKETDKPELPFVIGRLSSRILESKKFQMHHAKIVQNGQEAIAKNDKRVSVINTDNLSQRSDLVHFDQQGQMELGKLFGEAMIKAL